MIEVTVALDLDDLALQLARNLTRDELMELMLSTDQYVGDYGFTAELQAKLQAALNREDEA